MGMIIGTAAYMAPEQAKGRPVDRRADIWAFGAVLYEMLTGRRLFEAEDVSETLAAVLTRDANATSLPANIPPRLRALIHDCLIRDPKQRLRDIGEARRVLEKTMAGAPDEAAAGASATVASAPSRTRERLAWGAAVAFALLAAVAGAWALRPVAPPPETRLEIATPGADDPFSFAISPDGRSLVFVASAAGGQRQLWLRPLDQTTPQALQGTEGALFPFWSPDSRSVAFFSGNQLTRLDLGGGLPQPITGALSGARGGSWGADGVILFAGAAGPLLRVPATGGVPEEAVKFAPGQASQRFPRFLPGGRQFLFSGTGASAGLYLGSLDSQKIRRLGTADTNAEFVLPNWLLFVRQGTLVAQRVDLARGELTGGPVTVADRVLVHPSFAVGAFSASPAGPITYRSGTSTETQLTWFDRSGKPAGTIGGPDANGLMQPTLSPDGRRVVAYRTVQGNQDLWLFDAARMTKLTFDAGRETYPLWFPEGSRIAFSKEDKKAAGMSLYQKSSTGGGQEDLLLPTTRATITPQSWTRDGRFLLYSERHQETAGDLWVLPIDGTQKPSVFVNSRFEERMGQFSPDGRWVAYSSDESGPTEIYVRPFPASNGQWKASTTGGVTPRWRHDGKELYYIAPDGALMAVPFAVAGSAPEMGAPKALFHPRILNGGASVVGITWQYDVALDGRFLINVVVGDSVTAPITVIQHWQARIGK
jgi:Tol biopolymer transport system component